MYRINFKRTLSLLLCLLMLMSLLPMGAFATDGESPAEPPAPQADDEQPPTECSHAVESWNQIEGYKHQGNCTLCGEIITADCSGGAATCTAQAVCETCAEPYGEPAGHSLAYKCDDKLHWQECTVANCPDDNKGKTEAAVHSMSYNESLGTIIALCSANCGYEATASIIFKEITYGDYEETAYMPNIEKTGFLANEQIEVSYATKDGELLSEAPVMPGEYTASITYGGATATANFKINKKPVTATVSVAGKTFDNSTAATVSAVVPADQLVAGDSISITGLSGSFDDVNSGENKTVTVDSSAATVSGTNADCYEISYPQTATGTIEPLVVHSDAFTVEDMQYTGGTQWRASSNGEAISVSINSDDFRIQFLTTDNIPIQYYSPDVGENKTFRLSDPNGYQVVNDNTNEPIDSSNIVVTGTGSIEPADLTVSGTPSLNAEYGDKLSELSVSGLTITGVDGEEVPGTWGLGEGQGDTEFNSPDGPMESCKLVFIPNSGNYKPYPVTVTPEILPRKVTVSIVGNTKTVTYDGKEHSVSGYTLKYDDSFLKAEDIIFDGTEGKDTVTGTDAGVYEGMLTDGDFKCKNGNFKVTFILANQPTLTINKAPLKIIANDVIYHYGQEFKSDLIFSYSYEGFVNGEDESVLTDKPVINIDTTKLESAGDTVPIVVSGAKAANYEIEHVKGTVTRVHHAHQDSYKTDGLSIIATCNNHDGYCIIRERRATLSAVDVVYTGEPANAVTVENHEGKFGQEFEIRYTGTDYDNTVAPTGVGEYTVTLSVKVGDAVKASVSTQFSIRPKTLTISSITAEDKVYDGSTAIELKEVGFDGLVGNETVSIDTDSYTATAASADAGEDIPVTVTGIKLTGDDAKNYTLSENSGTTTVNIKQKIVLNPTATLSASEFTYNGKEHKPTVVLKDGETVITADQYAVSYESNTNAGTAKLKIVSADKNYKFGGTVEEEFTIKKAPLTAAPMAVSLTKGDKVPSLNLLVSGLMAGDEKTVTISPAAELKLYDSTGKEITPAEALKTAGTYTIKWLNMAKTQFTGIDNYTLTKTETAKFVVKNPPVSVSSSSDSGSYYYTAAPVLPSVTVPISGDEKTIHVKATVKGGTATIDDVSAEELHKVIGEHVETGTVTIDFTRLNTRQTITRVEIPADSVKAIADAVHDEENDAESLEIVLGSGRSIEFDAAALAEKVAQAKGKDITISIIHSDYVPTLTEAQREVVGKKDAFDINVYSGGKHISDMGGKITVHVPYVLKPGEDAEGIKVYYVDENGERELCQSSYDKAKKRVNFITDHLSLYVIEYEAQPLPAVQEDADQTDAAALAAASVVQASAAEDGNQAAKLLPWILLLILSLLGVAFGAFLLLRKRKE